MCATAMIFIDVCYCIHREQEGSEYLYNAISIAPLRDVYVEVLCAGLYVAYGHLNYINGSWMNGSVGGWNSKGGCKSS